MGEIGPGLVADANVLIDYTSVDVSILGLISCTLGPLYIPSPILAEVNSLLELDLLQFGVHVFEPSLEQVIRASSKRGQLSFQDHLCLLIAKDHGYRCITNDIALRKVCDREAVEVLWGVEVICLLVEFRTLLPDGAKQIILAMHHNNPRYISQTIVESALRKIGRA